MTRDAASQTEWTLERLSGCCATGGATQGHDRGKRLTLRSSLLRLGRDLGARNCGCADGRVTRTRRTGIEYSQKMNNKRGFRAGQLQARQKMHVLGELLGWWRGWLAGAFGWNESEWTQQKESSKGERSEQRERVLGRQRKPLVFRVL